MWIGYLTLSDGSNTFHDYTWQKVWGFIIYYLSLHDNTVIYYYCE